MSNDIADKLYDETFGEDLRGEANAAVHILWEEYCKYGQANGKSWPPSREDFKRELERRLDHSYDNDRR